MAEEIVWFRRARRVKFASVLDGFLYSGFFKVLTLVAPLPRFGLLSFTAEDAV